MPGIFPSVAAVAVCAKVVPTRTKRARKRESI